MIRACDEVVMSSSIDSSQRGNAAGVCVHISVAELLPVLHDSVQGQCGPSEESTSQLVLLLVGVVDIGTL
jgi:hypothetical protein